MRQQGQRLLRTLSEILDTAKLESQTIDLHPRECSAAEVLAQAVSEVRRLRSIEVLPLRVEIAPDLPPIAVDPIRFPQALSYLCGHVLDSLDAEAEAAAASEATAPQRPLARPPALGELLLRAYQAPGRPVLVFEVAYLPGQTPAGPVLGTAGLGLALPLARRLLALHGGSIVVIADAYPCLRANLPLPQRNR
jgi:signal transduction histidine kinase